MTAKRQWWQHAAVLLCVLIASFDTLEGLPIRALLRFDNLLYDEAISGDEGPVYPTNELHGSVAGRHSLAAPPLPSEVFSTENEKVSGKLLGRRRIQFSSEKSEIDDRDHDERNNPDVRLSYMHPRIPFPFRKADTGFPSYSATLNGKAMRLGKSLRRSTRRNRMRHNLFFVHLSKDGTVQRKDDRGLVGSNTKVVPFRLDSSSSKRDRITSVRNEVTVHPVFLGYGQETIGAALNTLARLLADEERLRQMHYTNERTKEFVRFIG